MKNKLKDLIIKAALAVVACKIRKDGSEAVASIVIQQALLEGIRKFYQQEMQNVKYEIYDNLWQGAMDTCELIKLSILGECSIFYALPKGEGNKLEPDFLEKASRDCGNFLETTFKKFKNDLKGYEGKAAVALFQSVMGLLDIENAKKPIANYLNFMGWQQIDIDNDIVLDAFLTRWKEYNLDKNEARKVICTAWNNNLK